MQRLVIGSLMAAVVMFVLGFVFYGVLGHQAYAPAPLEAGMELQTSMEANLRASGTYMVPADEKAWMTGPSAIINYVAAGDAPANMPVTMATGFVHMLVSALLFGVALMAVSGNRTKAVLWFGFAAAVFMHLGDPIWYGFEWRHALFVFVADAVMFIAGGLTLAWWLGRTAVAKPASAAAA